MLSSDPRIQSISIPTHSTRSSPTPHIVYNISISTPTHSYSIPHRYSSFTTLSESLTTECSLPPPTQLPSKRSSRWDIFGSGDLSEQQIITRRTGLETWLRAILSAKDPRWAVARCFREFLAAPTNDLAPGFTSTTWLTEQTALTTLARTLRATFARRDALLLQSNAGAHAVNLEAKKGLVEFVARLGNLTIGLDDLAKGGMPSGELHRRGEMVGGLQDEVEQLGKTAVNAPRLGSGSGGGGGGGDEEHPSQSRAALLGSGSRAPTSRVLGFGATSVGPKETAETRPLDSAGLIQLQQTYVAEQDSKLDSLTAALRRQRALGEMINEELAVHEELLDTLDKGTDRVQGRLKDANRLMKKL